GMTISLMRVALLYFAEWCVTRQPISAHRALEQRLLIERGIDSIRSRRATNESARMISTIRILFHQLVIDSLIKYWNSSHQVLSKKSLLIKISRVFSHKTV